METIVLYTIFLKHQFYQSIFEQIEKGTYLLFHYFLCVRVGDLEGVSSSGIEVDRK